MVHMQTGTPTATNYATRYTIVSKVNIVSNFILYAISFKTKAQFTKSLKVFMTEPQIFLREYFTESRHCIAFGKWITVESRMSRLGKTGEGTRCRKEANVHYRTFIYKLRYLFAPWVGGKRADRVRGAGSIDKMVIKRWYYPFRYEKRMAEFKLNFQPDSEQFHFARYRKIDLISLVKRT